MAQKEMARNLKTTGIAILDRTIGGGIPEGSLVYVSADPISMYEVFLYQFTQSRKSYYFTTERRPIYIKKDIENLGFDSSDRQIIFIDVYSQYYFTPAGEIISSVGNEYADAKILEFVEYNLYDILDKAEDINIIMDSFSFFMNLNINIGLIKRLLIQIYEITKETNGLTYLYTLKDTHENRIENMVMNACDVIFDVELERSSDKIVSKLSIPKIRGMIPSTELIRFKIGAGVQIDTSRDIV